VVESKCIKGQKLTIGTPLMVIADITPFYVIANVDEADISRVEPGQSANIVLDAYPGVTLGGKVDSIYSNAINTPLGDTVFPVKIEITSAGSATLRLGMTSDVDIVYASHTNVIVVPDEAVVRQDGKQIVFVVENSLAVRRDVELGVCTDDFCEIKSGLKPGEEIVTGNAGLLQGGESIKRLNG